MTTRRVTAAVVGVLSLGALASPSWSQAAPDARLAFWSYDVYRSGDVYAANADGTHARNLTATPGLDEVDPAWSPDGSMIAFAGETAQFTDHQIFVMPGGGGERRQVTDLDGTDQRSPAWSPDGSMIAFYVFAPGERGRVAIVPVAGGDPRVLTPAPTALGAGLTWTPDGAAVVFAALDGLYSVDVESGVQTKIPGTAAGDISPTFSPDGSRVAFAATSDDRSVVTVMAATGEARTPAGSSASATFQYEPAWSPAADRLVFPALSDGTSATWSVAEDGSDPLKVSDEAWLSPDLVACSAACAVRGVQASHITARVRKPAGKGVIIVVGSLDPPHEGAEMKVALMRLSPEGWRRAGVLEVPIVEGGRPGTYRFVARFDRPRPGSCRARVSFAGDHDHAPAITRVGLFGC